MADPPPEKGRRMAWLALGANLGDREEALSFAIRGLEELDEVAVIERSSVYETQAVGPGSQADYLNAVVSVETSLTPRELLDAMLEIERRAGRVRDGTRWGPRVLDLDLLFFADARIDEPGLTVPHPRVRERSFVLVPLAEIAPRLIDPGSGRTVAELRAAATGLPAPTLPAGIRRHEGCAS